MIDNVEEKIQGIYKNTNNLYPFLRELGDEVNDIDKINYNKARSREHLALYTITYKNNSTPLIESDITYIVAFIFLGYNGELILGKNKKDNFNSLCDAMMNRKGLNHGAMGYATYYDVSTGITYSYNINFIAKKDVNSVYLHISTNSSLDADFTNMAYGQNRTGERSLTLSNNDDDISKMTCSLTNIY